MAMHYNFDESQRIELNDELRKQLEAARETSSTHLPHAILAFCDGDVEAAYRFFLKDRPDVVEQNIFASPEGDAEEYKSSLETFRKFMRRKVWFWVG